MLVCGRYNEAGSNNVNIKYSQGRPSISPEGERSSRYTEYNSLHLSKYSQILLLFSVHTDAEKSNMLNQSFYLEYDIIFLINWLIDSSK